jgi:trk system potassium uptake protein TrkA
MGINMRIAIAGAGNVGRAIARELLENGHQVLLIDRDPKALKMESVPTAEWLLADACEITSLDLAKLDGCQVLVAATGDDKVNLVASLLGKTEYGVPRVVARVNHPKNEWMFDSSWGVDVAVSTPRIISALVEEAVSVGDVVRLFSFRKGEANLVEITLPDSAKCCGRTVGEVELPEDASLAAIVRDGRVISPQEHDVFAAGDELLFVASAKAEDELKACFIGA